MASGEQLRVLLGHPGGPYHAQRDLGAWSVPKGLVEDGEDALQAARREFEEETELAPPVDPRCYLDLGSVRYRNGKTVRAWAFEGECDPAALRSNTIAIEWPPRSGRSLEIPEIDRFELFPLAEAERRILTAQRPLLERLVERLRAGD
ncbi:MAG: NUDIX domain-containing protein [Acidobacteria bacterium]|nr:MAG: NUDIX domain-containing protein [Acidobacteriota bacterium]REK07955.1 MAG: NUDIX domain-containing protein [Acidobacteriota bacterium]